MYGSPIQAALIFLATFGLVGGGALSWIMGKSPNLERTHEASSTVSTPADTQLERLPCLIILRSAHPVAEATLEFEGKVIEIDWFSETEGEVELEVTNRVTFLLDLQWPEDSPETALLVQIEPDGEKSQSQTFWAEGNLKQEIKFWLTDEVGS